MKRTLCKLRTAAVKSEQRRLEGGENQQTETLRGVWAGKRDQFLSPTESRTKIYAEKLIAGAQSKSGATARRRTVFQQFCCKGHWTLDNFDMILLSWIAWSHPENITTFSSQKQNVHTLQEKEIEKRKWLGQKGRGRFGFVDTIITLRIVLMMWSRFGRHHHVKASIQIIDVIGKWWSRESIDSITLTCGCSKFSFEKPFSLSGCPLALTIRHSGKTWRRIEAFHRRGVFQLSYFYGRYIVAVLFQPPFCWAELQAHDFSVGQRWPCLLHKK